MRDQILDVAERLFAEHGFAGVSTRDIVAGTDLKNQASLYHHFENKRALYEAVLERAMQQLIEHLPRERGGTEEAIAVNIDRLMGYLSERPHVAKLIQRANIDDERYLLETVSSLLRPVYSQGREALRGANALWADEEIPHLAAGLFFLIFGYFANSELLKAVVGSDPLDSSAMDRQRRFIKTAVARLLGVQPQGEMKG